MADQTVKIGFFPESYSFSPKIRPTGWPFRARRSSSRTAHRGTGRSSITLVESRGLSVQGRSGGESPELRLAAIQQIDSATQMLLHRWPRISRKLAMLCRSAAVPPSQPERPTTYGSIPTMNRKARGLGSSARRAHEHLRRSRLHRPGFRHDRGTFCPDRNQNPTGKASLLQGGRRSGSDREHTNTWFRVAPTGQTSAFDLGRARPICKRRFLSDVSGSLVSTTDGRTGAFAVAP